MINRVVPFLLLTIVLPLAAQEPAAPTILAGFGIGMGLGFETSDLPVYAGSSDCGEFSTGQTILPSLDVRLVLPSLLADHVGLDARLRGAYSSGRLTSLPVDPTRILDSETGEVVTLDREFRLQATTWSASLDLLVRYANDRLAVVIGPSLGVRLHSSFSQTDNILGPGDYRFPDGQSSHPMSQGPLLANAALSFGPMAAVSYSIPFGGKKVLTPETFARLDLLAPVQDAMWRSLQVGLGAALLFDVTPLPAPPPPPPPPPVVEAPPYKPRLSASINVYAVDADGRRVAVPTVHVQELLYRQHAPLLAAIFFERDTAVVASRYVALDPLLADSFKVDALTGSSVLAIQHQALNIIGSRLRENPSAKLELHGSTSDEEAPALSHERAETVRSYLERNWGIDSSRIRIVDRPGPMQRSTEATNDGRADNRRVELASNVQRVLMPVVTETMERSFDPPMLQINPTFQAEAGVRGWEIEVSQGGREIARYTDIDKAAGNEPEIVWDMVRDHLDSTLTPVEAELTVRDSTGAVTTARVQVPLLLERRKQVVDKRVELHEDRERIGYSLVGFDFRSAELGKGHEEEIRAIAATVKSGASIVVVGYTDRIGDERTNANLSTQRAERVAVLLRKWLEALGIRDVAISSTGAGVETTRFGNDLPEGRVLSRGVSVVIEQEVGP